MSLQGPKGRIFISFLYKISEVHKNKGYLLIIYCPVHGVHGEPNQWIGIIIKCTKGASMWERCLQGFKGSHGTKTKLLTYPHIDGQLITERHEDSEVPSKHKWPLKTRCSTGIDNTERKINFWHLHRPSVLKKKF